MKQLSVPCFVSRRVLCAALGLCLLTAAAWAQNLSGDIFQYPLNRGNQGAMDAFLKTCSSLAQNPIVRGNFEQEKILSRLNRSLKSSGSFLITKDDGMVWDTLRPYPSTLVLGRNYLVQFRPGGEKTVLSAAGNETFLRFAEVISAVFSGRPQGLLDNFEIYYRGDPTAWELGLIPLDKAIKSSIERIAMAGNEAIRFIDIHEQNGDFITYSMLNISFSSEMIEHEKSFFQIP